MAEINFNIALQPKQKEAFKLSLEFPVFAFGGAKGGGKSFFVRARELYRRLQYPFSTGCIIRQTYGELWDNHIRQFFIEYPELKTWYSAERKTIEYPNGSVTQFVYLRNEKDALVYQGRSYDDISFDEATQHPYESFAMMSSCNRLSNPKLQNKIKPSMILTCNPGGIGHDWVKRLFIDRNFNDGENQADYGFLQSFLKDNKVLRDADINYEKRLLKLPEHLRKAYLDGDWDVFGGICFSELNEKVHIINNFKLPAETVFFGGYDWGYSHPFAFVLLAITPDGNWYVVDYISEKGLLTKEHGQKIIKLVSDYQKAVGQELGNIDVYAGHDIWNRTGNISTRYEDLQSSLGSFATIIRADNNREQRVSALHRAFTSIDNNPPQLRFFRSAEKVFARVRSMQTDPKKPEDVIKVDANEFGDDGDDLYDALSFGVLTREAPRKKLNFTKTNTGADLINLIMRRSAYYD